MFNKRRIKRRTFKGEIDELVKFFAGQLEKMGKLRQPLIMIIKRP